MPLPAEMALPSIRQCPLLPGVSVRDVVQMLCGILCRWREEDEASGASGRNDLSGRYSAAYVGPDGKLHLAPRTYEYEHDAEGWLAGERRKIDLGTWGAVERSDAVTLRAYATQWIEHRQLRPRTRQHYEALL